MSNHKIERENYICKNCKTTWSQPCCEVPRCPKCPPFKDFNTAKASDLFAIGVVGTDLFWHLKRGEPPVNALKAGLFRYDSDDIQWALKHVEKGKCELVSKEDMHKLISKMPMTATEVLECLGKRQLRDYTSAERKEMPVWTLMAEYFPDAMVALARHSKKCNDKHNPGEPMHWARGKSADHLECAARHLLTPDRKDETSGETELVAALWRLAAEVQLREEKRLVAAGIRPLSGVVK